ncbi:30S ribosomal protein S12 methylthiotransferase RimO [Porphyromonas sp.]|uniref:30S ribosomal protein S12 methylthiotransferase RimO n=1 Tax=Porphyromonas sp. TaxID=1924944 RepID=UPI0026DC6E85|nr:30S ribosomal protein S12 methylthiotransferase RimO [Porphyromonas sp.]MDO4770303.1 30S ribosomal protein S12 methylthiotransferase RimO [Porphyromonas sp.]
MRKNKVDVITLGCSKNLVDSEMLMKQFASSGYTVAHDPELVNGEIVVVNTCGFIEAARQESIDMILNIVEAKKRGDVGKLYVMGCLSERYMDELKAEIPDVDGYYGKFNWKGLVSELGKAYHTSPADLRILTTPRHYAFVKISEGCDRKCAYCSIPIMTGRHISRPMEDIINEVRGMVSGGVKEIQLIAQDLTYYGRDLYHKSRLADLLNALCEIEGLVRIRLHYGYPAQFPYEILPVMREQKKICKYIDIALQHISDPILKKMRRHVTDKETRELIRRFREEVPGIHIRTTMMVGHPGETEEDFQRLLDFVKETRFERLGAFMYSHEDGTYGYDHYEDDIPAEVKQDRLDRLMSLQESIAFEVAAEKVGQTLDVIIDRTEGDYYIGRTEYDSPDVDPEVLIPMSAKVLEIGEIYPVFVNEARDFDLVGHVI